MDNAREAYVHLRAQARNERRKLVTLCSEVIKDAAPVRQRVYVRAARVAAITSS
jgi:hypothetical protein